MKAGQAARGNTRVGKEVSVDPLSYRSAGKTQRHEDRENFNGPKADLSAFNFDNDKINDTKNKRRQQMTTRIMMNRKASL